MSGLALRTEPSECETATSWASRLAERNGCAGVQDLVHDMGISWKAFRTGDPRAVTALCELAKTDADKLLKSTYRTGDSATSKWIGNEWIAPKLMRFDILCICPNCIADAKHGDDNTLKAGAPVWWYMEGVRVCPIHERALVHLPPPERGRCKHDYAGRVRDNRALVHAASNSRDRIKAGDFEDYVANRLKFGAAKSLRWIDGLDLATIIRASERLGLVALGFSARGQKITDERTLIAATSLGFNALSSGPTYLMRKLAKFRPKPSKGGFYADFFPFSRWLERIQHRPGCARLCDAMHDFVVQNYPCEADEVIYGKPVQKRHIHSISSAAERAKVPFPRMRKALGAAREGKALSHLPRPDQNLWVKTYDWDAWLEEFGNAITLKPAARRLGVCSSTFSRLVSAGHLKPLAAVPEMAPRYLPCEIDTLVANVTPNAVTLGAIPKGMLTINSVQTSCKTSISVVLQLLMDRRLRTVGILKGKVGLSGICIAIEEVLDELEGPPLAGLGSDELRKYLRINCMTTPWLVSNGFLKSEMVLHPRTRKSIRLFRHEVIEQFLNKYETVGRLSRRLATKPPYVVRQLKQIGLEPLPVERNMSVIYHRSDLPDEFL